MFFNVEIKARTNNSDGIRAWLEKAGARYIGLDHQVDTFFHLPEGKGRLKLREGNIENALIHYQRPNREGPKTSEVSLYQTSDGKKLKEVVKRSLGEKVVVDKQRYIYFMGNVKFHIDEVKELGAFVEIEAIDEDGSIGLEKLNAQCTHFMKELGVSEEDLVDVAYADLLLNRPQGLL